MNFFVCTVLTEEQTFCNLRAVFAGLRLVKWLWFLVCHRLMTDDLGFDWVHTCDFVLEICEPICRPTVITKSSPCVIPEALRPSCRNKFFKLSPSWYPQLLRCACFVTCAIHVLLSILISWCRRPFCPPRAKVPIQVSELLRESMYVACRCA